MKRGTGLIAALTCLLYAGAIFFGLRVKHMTFFPGASEPATKMAWVVPQLEDLPSDSRRESVRRGFLLFTQTPLYAPTYATAHVSCSSCHAAGGIQPYAAPMVGLPALFPMYNKRAGRIISLEDRVEECFVRSENGKPLPTGAPQMNDIVNYIDWLSQPEPGRSPYVGRGFISLSNLEPDPARGATIYAAQCAGCHGVHGEGKVPLFPPLWGADSFNDGAGMHSISKMAPFVQHNMPQNRPGLLTAQEAFDVAGYIHAQERPAFNQAYKRF